MTILHPVRQRLSAARLYAVVVPAPFTPPDALVRRVEDLVSAGVDIVQLDLDDWAPHDAVAVLNRCAPVVVPTGRLLVVAHDPSVAIDLGADAMLLGPAQNLPSDLIAKLGPHATFGREVSDEGQLSAALEARNLYFVVLIGDRSTQVAARAHQLAPLAVPDAYADPQAGSRPWFVDLGPEWTDPAAVPERACRVRFDVFVPADSPTTESIPQLRADVAAFASLVARRWDEDDSLTARRDREYAENSASSTSFQVPGTGEDAPADLYDPADPYDSAPYDSADPYDDDSDPQDSDPQDSDPQDSADPHDTADPYDSDAVHNYRNRSERSGGVRHDRPRPIRDFLNRVFHREPGGSPGR